MWKIYLWETLVAETSQGGGGRTSLGWIYGSSGSCCINTCWCPRVYVKASCNSNTSYQECIFYVSQLIDMEHSNPRDTYRFFNCTADYWFAKIVDSNTLCICNRITGGSIRVYGLT